jgi:hypothetical protein
LRVFLHLWILPDNKQYGRPKAAILPDPQLNGPKDFR